ncbi:type IX secretion system protein PorD [Jiulongibacter sp. NS-SX5]|uniref:type IX secretion system protein PorD n=1 Tax=Jiulongibacter sp. NS-SX5 TaxID=3463854 RepID=UPI0040597688
MRFVSRIISLCCLMTLGFHKLSAQELNARVEINYQQMQSTIQYQPGLFKEMESQIQQFMNNTRWTDDIFNQDERIECQLTINLMQSSTQNLFTGNARFQVARPVYGTNYNSVTFQYIDKNFNFSYQPVERQMVYNEQVFTSQITELAAYYSLMALAVDYDSFSELGGSPHLSRLFNLLQLAQATRTPGWTQDDKAQRNRYWIVENMQNQQFSRMREEFYKYHRLILDDFGRDPAKGRSETLKFLEVVQNIATLRPNSVYINAFFDAKAPEFINIFSEGSPTERQKAFLLLSGLDPDKTEQYRKIIQG